MLLLILCTLLWSISGVMIKTIPWHAFVLAGGRSLIAGGVMAVYIKARGLRFTINRTSLLAAAMLSGTFLTFVPATKMTTAANAIVIQASAPVFVLIYNGFFRKQRVSRLDAFAVLFTILGISLFFFEQIGGGQFLGNLLALVSGITLAGTYIITCGAEEDERMSGILFAHLFTAVIGLPFALFNATPLGFDPVFRVVLLGVVQLGIPYVLFGIAVRHCPPLACSLICLPEAVFNPTWVFLFTGERPSTLSLFGGALVLITIGAWAFLSQRNTEKEVLP